MSADDASIIEEANISDGEEITAEATVPEGQLWYVESVTFAKDGAISDSSEWSYSISSLATLQSGSGTTAGGTTKNIGRYAPAGVTVSASFLNDGNTRDVTVMVTARRVL